MNKLTIRDIDVKDKRVLVRVDFNVPMNEGTGEITDDSRIRASLPTIQYLIKNQAKVILCSHMGRPKGAPEDKYRLAPVAKRLAELLDKPVATTRDCVGPEAEQAAKSLKSGDVLLLENLRFHVEEEKNGPEFARGLANLAEIYVDDAFGTAHRAHASIVGVAQYLPAVAGFLLEKELVNLGGILTNPVHPFAALLGGAKVSDKVALMENVIGKVDYMFIGGGMAATFLKSEGYEVGQSLIEADRIETAGDLLRKARENNVNLILPVDVVITDEASDKGSYQVVNVKDIPNDKKIVDIGPETVEIFTGELKKCKTVFWNGPMGIYEIKQFAKGTVAMAQLLITLQASTVIGGGSTADMVYDMGLADKMTFVSTGGGASMSFLSGEKLPGVEALNDKK
ncbi:MAG: phosphoglycerate kinase [Dehalococcoidales bacterium]|nr:phosphoglycerate kinase [Dehalococcoidales bacterium]